MSVEAIISDSRSFANNWVHQADALINRIALFAYTPIAAFSDPSFWMSYGYTDLVRQQIDNILRQQPQKPNVNVPSGVAEPAAPSAPTINSVTPVSIAPFNKEAPSYDTSGAPSLTFPAKSFNAAPTFTAPNIGSAPNIDFNQLKTLPQLDAINIPSPPSLPTITFSSVAPSDAILTPPSFTFDFDETAYSSDLLNLLKSKLRNDLTFGGYGIENNDELMLWDRAREREVANANQAINEIERSFSSRRFSVPPGTLFSALEKAHQALQDASSTLSREIALKRADLYVQNRQFTIEQSAKLEEMLIQYHGSMMERLLNARKYITEIAIEAYNTRVKSYNAMLDRYKTEAQVFEARLRANSTLLEQYRISVEAEKIRSDVNTARINQHKALVEANSLLISLYKAQVEAAGTAATIEKLKLDAFRAQVEAYVAEVQAKTAEFNAYEAKVRGELGKVQIYDAQVRAYLGTVEAAKAKAEVESLEIKAQIEKAKLDLERYNSEIAKYKYKLDSILQIEGLKERIYETDVRAYEAVVKANEAAARLAVDNSRANNEALSLAAQNNISKSKLELEKAIKQAEFNFNAAHTGVNIYTEMLKAALNSINALAVSTKIEDS